MTFELCQTRKFANNNSFLCLMLMNMSNSFHVFYNSNNGCLPKASYFVFVGPTCKGSALSISGKPLNMVARHQTRDLLNH